MIIKGTSRFGAASLAAHLGSAKNERVEIAEIRGLLAGDLLSAFREMEDIAAGSSCTKFMYHANIDPHSRFPMTPAQWQEAVDALERKLGFVGQPRAIVVHVKEGREHRHVVWSRVRDDTMRAIPDSHNYRKHEEVARDLERRFGHDRVQGAHAERDGQKRPERTPSRADIQQQERRGKTGGEAVATLKQIKAEVTALWQRTRTGQDFAAALAEHGYILARGDRRDFVVVDRGGAVHSLPRRIKDVRTAAVRARMADVDRDGLPSIAEAKALSADRRRDAAQDGAPSMTEKQRDRNADEPAASAERTSEAELAADIEKDAARQPERQAAMLAKMERQAEASQAFLDEQKDAAAQAQQQEAQQRRSGADSGRDEIADPKLRYARALADEYQVQAPYGSLARAAMNEYGRFAEQQAALSKQIAAAATPEQRRSLELRKTIEGCEYMAITSQRLAGMSRVISGDMNSEQAQRDEAKAKFYQERAAELRAERAEVERERGGRQAEPAAPKKDAEKQGHENAARPEPAREIATGAQPTTWRRTASGEAESAPLRPGEAPRTVAHHEAINRGQEAEKRMRQQQRGADKPSRDDSRDAAAVSGSAPRNESAAQREQRRKEMMKAATRENQGTGQGRDGSGRNGPGRGGGGRDR